MAERDLRTVFLAIAAIGTLALTFFSIPEAIENWIPIVTPFINWIPSTFLDLGQNLLLALVAFGFGYLMKPTIEKWREDESTGESIVREIEGCIKKDEIVWRGAANFANGDIIEIEFPRTPRCPDCLKDLQRESYDLPTPPRATLNRRFLWECIDKENCGYSATRESDQHSIAKKLFQGEVRKIIESEDEDYSLDVLVDRIEGEITPRSVWQEYEKIADDDYVSVNCFH